MGNIVFKIEGLTETHRLIEAGQTNARSTLLMPYGLVEEWSGNLGSGLIKLSDTAAYLHGINCRECGLLTVTRCYHHRDRSSVLELFEKAATKASSFCFSTTILLGNYAKRPVFCMGRSINSDASCPDAIVGIFIFPNLQ
jgi:hypothetical protein